MNTAPDVAALIAELRHWTVKSDPFKHFDIHIRAADALEALSQSPAPILATGVTREQIAREMSHVISPAIGKVRLDDSEGIAIEPGFFRGYFFKAADAILALTPPAQPRVEVERRVLITHPHDGHSWDDTCLTCITHPTKTPKGDTNVDH